MDHEIIWMSPGENVFDQECHTIQSHKFMVTVIWNPIGFHIVKLSPTGDICNNLYYIGKIQQDIISWWQIQRKQTGLRLIIYSDNTHPHTAK
jgi:hypothetical protein